MKKKTLKKKISDVFWWTLGLSILYFLIGAYLQSDGPIFDPAKTYELIKDTLTLAATFLAPVAAFVLFSDWREEHNVKEIHSTIDMILELASEIELQLINCKKSIENPNIQHVDNNIISLLIRLSVYYIRLDEEDDSIGKFKESVLQYSSHLRDANKKLEKLEKLSVEIKEEDSCKRQEYNITNFEYQDLLKIVIDDFNQMVKLSVELKKNL